MRCTFSHRKKVTRPITSLQSLSITCMHRLPSGWAKSIAAWGSYIWALASIKVNLRSSWFLICKRKGVRSKWIPVDRQTPKVQPHKYAWNRLWASIQTRPQKTSVITYGYHDHSNIACCAALLSRKTATDHLGAVGGVERHQFPLLLEAKSTTLLLVRFYSPRHQQQ